MFIPQSSRSHYRYLRLGALVAVLIVAGNRVATIETFMQDPGGQALVLPHSSIKSDKYHGTLVFRDQYGKNWDGEAWLEVNEKERTFTLTDRWNEKHTGKLVTVLSEQRIPGGHITFDGDREISIKWTQDKKDSKRLKIINAKGACVVFRFCSDGLIGDECKNELTQPGFKPQASTRQGKPRKKM